MSERLREMPELMTPKEAAWATGLSTRALRRLAAVGRVKAVVLTRQNRYVRESLQRLLDGEGNHNSNERKG